jgi:FKBP-type peptidyl-prolyl cis-trans isomerase SlpA
MISPLVIGTDTRVTLHFSLKLEDGGVVDSNFDKEPASFVVGDGNLLGGFEKRLMGLSAGDKASFEIPPEDAFGQPNPNNIQHFKRSDFSVDMVLEPGLVISFADPSGELPGVVKTIDGDKVDVDFNHPLSGRVITFSVEIVAVEPAPQVQAANDDLAQPLN